GAPRRGLGAIRTRHSGLWRTAASANARSRASRGGAQPRLHVRAVSRDSWLTALFASLDRVSRSSTVWQIRTFERRDADAVVELWREAGLTRAWNDPYQDIERKLKVQPELFLVAEVPGAHDSLSRIVGA